jgi:hypothetical protein
MDREKLAWAAGFCDGEGSFNTSRMNILFSISQVDTRCLEKFKDAVGGIGYIRGPYQGAGNRQPHYIYSTSKFEHVQAIIAMLWHWLGPVKRAQAEGVLRRAGSGRRARTADKGFTSCKNGHPRDETNTRVRVDKDGRATHTCLICDKAWHEKRRMERTNALRDELERQAFLRGN